MRLRFGHCRWSAPSLIAIDTLIAHLALIALVALIALAVPAPRARADIGRFLGFERPLLIDGGWGGGSCYPIDIGADGRTDLLFRGSGILNGTESLDFGLYLLFQGPDGHWTRTESIFGSRRTYGWDPLSVVDLDRDGLEDLVLEADDGDVVFYRQNRNGLLLQAGTHAVPADWDDVRLFPIGDGRIVRIGSRSNNSGDRGPLEALLLEWKGGGEGFHLAWQDTLSGSEGLGLDRCGIARVSDVPYVVGSTQSNPFLWAAAITPEGPGVPIHSRPLPDLSFTPLQVTVGRRLLLWSRTLADTYYDVVPGPDSLSLTLGHVPGMPKLLRNDTPAILPRPDGSTTIALSCNDSLGYCVAYARIDGGLPPRHEGMVRWGDSRIGALVATPDRLEILALSGDRIRVLPSEDRIGIDPDLPFRIDEAIATQDIDGDGITDLIFDGHSTGESAGGWIARGIDRYPWFANPEALPITEDIRSVNVVVGDLDGDGKRDILLIARKNDDYLYALHPYFQGEAGFVPGDSMEIPGVYTISAEGAGDFDGDGRVEIPYQMHLYDGAVRLLRWNRDRTVDSSVGTIAGLTGRPIASGDFDGDGKDELLVSSGILSIVRLYPSERTFQTVIPALTPTDLSANWVGDANHDGRDELYLQDQNQIGVLYSFGVDGTARKLQDGILRLYSSVSTIADIDADGDMEIVSITDSDGSIEIDDDLAGSGEGPAVWFAPFSDAVSGANPLWRDVDHDGDLDPIFFCADGIYVGRNDAVSPVASPGQDGMLRIVSASPAGTSARVAVRPARTGPISLGLYDVTGRAMWKERRESAPAGVWTEFVVRPSPREGAIARGVYFLRVEGGGRVATRRILLGF